MKKCISKKILIQYGESELNGQDKQRVERHLNICEDCCKQYHELCAVTSLLAGYERSQPNPREQKVYYQGLDSKFPGSIILLQNLKKAFEQIDSRRLVWGFAGGVVVLLVLLIIPKQKILSPVVPAKVISTTMVVRNGAEQITDFLDESEMLFLELKNAIESKTFLENRKRARKLITMVGDVHDIGVSQNNVRLLSYLVQSELIFYEVANFQSEVSEVKKRFISEAVKSKQLWKTLKKLQQSIENEEVFNHVSI